QRWVHVLVSPSQTTGNMTVLMITIDGGTLPYSVSGAGPPIVFVAGLGDRGTYWTAQVAAFSAAFQVVTFDHRGVGASVGPAALPSRAIGRGHPAAHPSP